MLEVNLNLNKCMSGIPLMSLPVHCNNLIGDRPRYSRHTVILKHLMSKTLNADVSKEGGWECFCRYIDQNCFSYFLPIQWTDRCHLAAIRSWQQNKDTSSKWPLLVLSMLWKLLKQFCSMYLQLQSQRRPSKCPKLYTTMISGEKKNSGKKSVNFSIEIATNSCYF